MLETREQRTKLLKAGFEGKAIEKIYICINDLKITNKNILFTETDT